MSEQMSFANFKQSTAANSTPPLSLGKSLTALWHDHRGEWEMAHTLAQEDTGKDGAWVHAYLHRKEGDLGNAAYWYRLAGRPVATSTVPAEWDEIARELLGRAG